MKSLISTLLLLAMQAALIPIAHAGDALKPDANGYIRDWLMLAPVPLPEGRSGGDLILEDQVRNESALRPKSGDKVQVRGKEFVWKQVSATTNFFDFNAVLKTINDRAAGYLVTYIECDKDLTEVIMAVGSNDEGRIYLNGEDIYAFTEPRTLELDGEKGKVKLNKGINTVIFKVVNEQNAWQAAMRFLDKAGAPMTNLTIRLAP